MDYKHALNAARDIALLKLGRVKALAAKEDSWMEATFVIFLSALASGVGPAFFPRTQGPYITYRPAFFDVVGDTILFFIQGVIFILVSGMILEYLFKSKLEVKDYYNIMGLAAIVGLFNFIPPLAFVGGFWFIFILWNVLTEVAKLKTGEIFLFLLINIALFWVIGVV